MNFFKFYKNLPKSIYILFLVQIINRFGDFVVPFLTLYLTQKLGYSFKISGIIVMITSLISIPGALYGGKFADQIGRRKTYIINQTLAGIFLIPCAFINKPYLIVICLIMSTFFNGAVRPAISAVIVDSLPIEKRQVGYSLSYLGINIGVAVGPILAGFLFKNHLPFLFIGDALTSFIAVIVFYINIKETKTMNLTQLAIEKEKVEEEESLIKALLKRPEISIFLIIYIGYSFVYSQDRFSLPLMLEDVFRDSGAEKFGYLMSINAFTVILMTMFITNITRKLKPLANMVLAGVLYSIGFGMIGIIKTFSLFIISTIIWTIGEIIVVTNFNVYIANNSPSNFRARFSSVGSLSWAIGGVLGTSLVGRYIDMNGIKEVWPLVFKVASLSTILMVILYLYSVKKYMKKSKNV